MFVPGRPLEPTLMFLGKARSQSLSGAPEKRFTQKGPKKNLDKAGKDCKGQTLKLITTIGNLQP